MVQPTMTIRFSQSGTETKITFWTNNSVTAEWFNPETRCWKTFDVPDIFTISAIISDGNFAVEKFDIIDDNEDGDTN